MLSQLFEHLRTNPARASRELSNLAQRDPAKLRTALIAGLRQERDSAMRSVVAALIVKSGFCEDLIVSPSLLTLEQAIELERNASAVDPMIEVRLGNRLLGANGQWLRMRECLRLLEVLHAASPGARVLPLVARLARHPHPHVRSKALLLLARGNRNAGWARERLADADPRIRANVLEALWDAPPEATREIFLDAAGDPNNRVAGNALLGLYRSGDARVFPLLARMASHPSAAHRSTATWVMGETGDRRFIPLLEQVMMQEKIESLWRERAAQALSKIREQPAPEGVVHIEAVETPAGDGWRAIHVDVTDADGRKIAGIPAVCFTLWCGASAILDYRVIGQYDVRFPTSCAGSDAPRIEVRAGNARGEAVLVPNQAGLKSRAG